MTNIGVIGLGVMGKNIIFNIVDHGFTVHVFNRTTSKTQEIEKVSPRIIGHNTLEAFISSLSSPRRILLMVASGKPVDEYLEHLGEHLDATDIVIDGGNSDFKDTIRRTKTHRFNFVGCGISGGEYGARNGPSLMVGCKKDVYDQIKEVLETISAQGTCCGWMGEDGAGHFIKTVHNGIEYAEMQLLQEILNISLTSPLPHEKCQEVFSFMNSGRCNGYLIEICEKILKKKEDGEYAIYCIEDKAEQKGTGKICVLSGIEADEDVSFIAKAVFSRYLSNNKEKREGFYQAAKDTSKTPHQLKEITRKGTVEKETIEKAFYLCKQLIYTQGAHLMMKYKEIHGWSYTISEICDVWKDGCILRCKFLNTFREMAKNDAIETSPQFIQTITECLDSLTEVCKFAIDNRVYAPLFTDCLMWINGLAMRERNGILIQAMRDYFGRHGVTMRNGEARNIEWDSN